MLYNDLALFVTVAEVLNFSKAAEELGIPASRVSRRLADLEEQLGYKLFERTTRSVRLTEEGRLLLDRSQMPIEALRELGGGINSETSSTIRITAPSLATRTTIGSKLLDFAEANPFIKLELVTSYTNLDFIRDNIDVAFRLGPIKDELLVAKPLWEVPYTFCVGKSFYKEHNLRKTINQKQLLSLPAIMFGTTWPINEGQTISPSNIVHTFGEPDIILQAVERNLGIALLPTAMLTDKVQALNVKGMIPTKRIMNAVYPSRRLLPARVRSLIDYIACH